MPEVRLQKCCKIEVMLWKEGNSSAAHADTNGKSPTERAVLRNVLNAARPQFIESMVGAALVVVAELVAVSVVGGDWNESCNSYKW